MGSSLYNLRDAGSMAGRLQYEPPHRHLMRILKLI